MIVKRKIKAQKQQNILKIIRILKNVQNVNVGLKENEEDVIILDVIIFGANMNFVGYVGINMNLHIIKILFQLVSDYMKVIIKEN
jgi:hypothetical protein